MDQVRRLRLWRPFVGSLALVASVAALGQTSKSNHAEQQANPASQATVRPADDNAGYLTPGMDPENRLVTPFLKHMVGDQIQFWTSPKELRKPDARKAFVPFVAFSGLLVATDSWMSKQVPDKPSQLTTSKNISNYSVFSLIGASAGSYAFGLITHNEHLRETGFLSGEAAINSTLIAYALKGITQRQRPTEGNGHGNFFQGGSSFPSEHAAVAWSAASVIAHEYPGKLTQIVAYGLASAVTVTRTTGKQHFPSDAFIGSALGWYLGRQVYRAHHDTRLGGAPWGDLRESKPEGPRNPANMGSPYVPLDSWVYRAIDRLAALGYVRSAYVGIRPWTRMECARLTEEAGADLASDELGTDEASRTYQALLLEFTSERARLDGARNLGASVESIYTRVMNISGPPLRDGYHFAQTIVDDYGRPFGEGTNVITGASGSAVVGPIAFYVRGEYQGAPSVFPFTGTQLQAMQAVDLLPPSLQGFSSYTGSYSRFQLLEGSVSLNLHNTQISFGKQSAWLGPSQSGPLLFSNNAAPIPMLKIDTTAPFKIPLVSKALGKARIEFFLGRLSGQQWINSPPTIYGPYPDNQPFIHGDKISFKPTENLEFGMGITAMFGGAGVPVTFSEFFRTYYSHKANLAENPGKRFSAADFSYRIPGLRKWVTVYGDSMVVDEISPIGSTRASVMPGVFLPQIPKLPKLSLRGEWVRVPNTQEFSPGFVYTDRRYTSGYTNDGFLQGSWIGRAGSGGRAWATYHFSARNTLEFGYRAQRVYERFLQGGSLNDFSAKYEGTFGNQFGITAMAQYENWRFPLLAPDRKMNFTSSVQLTYWPRWSKGS